VARTIRDAKLETRAARDRLKPGRKPHFKTLIPGKLHLGYRRKRKDEPGQWLVRHYLGGERYRVASLGAADDFQDMLDADGAHLIVDVARGQVPVMLLNHGRARVAQIARNDHQRNAVHQW
jgi:hypothetical protein